MTYAELNARMSNAEFELWMAEEEIRSHSCPMCGLEPLDMAKGLSVEEFQCPVCREKYKKVQGG